MQILYMKYRILKYFLVIILISIFIILVITLAFYQYMKYTRFKPYLQTIESKYNELPENEKKVSTRIQDVIITIEQPDFYENSSIHSLMYFLIKSFNVNNLSDLRGQWPVITSWVVRNLLWDIKWKYKNYLDWHLTNILWLIWLEDNFSKDQILSFYCHYLPCEIGNGLVNCSEYHFNKEISDLSVEEIIKLLAISKILGNIRRGTADLFISSSEEDIVLIQKKYYKDFLELYIKKTKKM
jgi:membrane carboxypeptidase/penicillin-binding protein